MIGLEGTRNGSSAARQHAVPMDYYNSNLLRARTGAGLSSSSRQRSAQDPLYRSNSSLELTHADYPLFGGSTQYIESRSNDHRSIISPMLKREYGSHGSIDVIAAASDRNSNGCPTNGEHFFAMLQDYRPTVLDMIDGKVYYSPPPKYSIYNMY